MAGRKSKRRSAQSSGRERGIDDRREHNLVLFHLRLLDDDDDYQLFCEMEREDDEIYLAASIEQWERAVKQLATPTVPTESQSVNRSKRRSST